MSLDIQFTKSKMFQLLSELLVSTALMAMLRAATLFAAIESG
jgi:hypothetical protein